MVLAIAAPLRHPLAVRRVGAGPGHSSRRWLTLLGGGRAHHPLHHRYPPHHYCGRSGSGKHRHWRHQWRDHASSAAASSATAAASPPSLVEDKQLAEAPSAREAKFQDQLAHAGTLLPGFAVSAVVMKGGFVSAKVLGTGLLALQGITGASPLSGIPLAIVLGVCVNNSLFNSSLPASLQPGVNFCKDPLLKMGIVCIGMKLSALDIISTGAFGVPAVCMSIGAGMYFIPRLGAHLGLEPKMSALIAAGTSICGVTAITALTPAIGASKRDMTFAVANVVTFGTMGMLIYPYVAHLMFEHSEQIGLFLGLGVHDTSQVIGAALTYDQVYGDEVVLKSATVTKLTRNMFLAAAIPYLTWAHAQQYSDVAAGKAVDKMALLKKSSFVLGFIGMSCVRTVGDLGLEDYGLALGLFDAEMWKGICKFVGNELSGHYLLGTAMAAVGLSTSRSDVQGVGYQPFVLGLCGALTVGGVGFGMACAMPYVMEAFGTPLGPAGAQMVEIGLEVATTPLSSPSEVLVTVGSPAVAEPAATMLQQLPTTSGAESSSLASSMQAVRGDFVEAGPAVAIGAMGGVLAGGAIVGLELLLGCGGPS